MTKKRALDLFCGAGGAAMGIFAAGYEVTGVDIAPQPNFPFAFIQGDALAADLEGFDFVWASPPCQKHSALKALSGKDYECFIERTREKLKAWGGPYIIENVVGAPLENPIQLCGSSFGLGVRRHRIFESNRALQPKACDHKSQPFPIDVTGTGGPGGRHRKPKSIIEACRAMGIDWMTRRELSQAIPPAYAKYLCNQL